MAQVRPVTSEALEAQIRALLPSQNGFTEDLQASNVIMPIIDLTSAAGGTNVPEYQSQALAFGSQTVFSVNNTTTTLANTPGFWRLLGTLASDANSPVASNIGSLQLTDGLSTKTILQSRNRATTANIITTIVPFDLIVFLGTGESISAVAATTCNIVGSYRQIADVNGTVVNPSGFTPQ